MTCQGSGTVECPETTLAGGRDFVCTDYNVGAVWSSGVNSITQRFPVPGTASDSYFVGYQGCCWADDITGGNYGLMTAINLSPRLDNGLLNSSPKTTMFPVVRIQRGCTENIRIPMLDADRDYVSCHLATNPDDIADSCHSLCDFRVPNIELNPDNAMGCILQVTASGSRSQYAVALVVQDRQLPSSNPLSSVPLQFVLEYYGTDNEQCAPRPTFVPDTPEYGIVVVAQPTEAGMSGSITIVVRSSADGESITDIVTLSPLNTRKTELTTINDREASIEVTFIQGAEQPGSHSMCFYGNQTNGISSEIRCITVAFDVTAPQIVLDAVFPNVGEAVDPNFEFFQIVFNQEVKRPLQDRFISLFNSIDDSNPVQVFNTFESELLVFPERNSGSGTIPMNVNTPLDPGEYYFVADEGAVVGSAIGGLDSEALASNVWHFSVTGIPPDPCLTPELCQNGGTCDPLPENSGFTCLCSTDFKGANCENQNPCSVSADVCQNDGVCEPNGDFTDYSCDCLPNFVGESCENGNPCLSAPCLNEAVCTPSLANTEYTCSCASGFMGTHCENEDPCLASPSVCQNNGVCAPISENTDFQCTCVGAFIGKDCSDPLPIDPCSVPMLCENGATCHTLPGEYNYTCECAEGFMGRNCRDEFECPDSASYSSCIAPCGPTCYDPIGGSGENCTDPCTEGCVCNEGYLLEDDLCIPASECGCLWTEQYIQLHGVVVNHNCTERCSCVSNGTLECVSIECADDATCAMRDDHHYTCMCNEGFEGNGMECQPGTRFDEQETCTTPECKRGCFSSPNYPENYRQRWTKQYIVNVPGAMYYTVKCDEIFHIEEIRDALYVGPENPPPSNTLPIDPEEPILLFYGETPPDRFLVDSGEMWMYFITDRLEEHEGWRCCWIADDPCWEDPCMNDGQCEGHDDGSYSCVCVGGWRGQNCELGLAHCSAHGDPHYSSFDGKRYDFQGACKYYLLKYCGEDDEVSFDIIQENEPPSNNAHVTITKEITIRIFGMEIGMNREMSLTIDGLQLYLPVIRPGVHITFRGNSIVAQFNNTLEVEWTGNGVDVELSYEYSNQTCGLCGNMDMDDDNDFKTPDNEEAENAAEFGNSWKYNDCNRDDDPERPHPCEGLPFALDDASFFCSVIKRSNGPFRNCHGKFDPEPFYQDCVYDSCATHPQLDACSNIASYAAVCKSNAIEVGTWRTEEFCSLRCPEHSSYNPCMTACPLMCGEPEQRQDDFRCPFPCVEGCECDDGHVLDGNQRCVPENGCGCVSQGVYHRASEFFYTTDCAFECECLSNTATCVSSSCHAESFCGVADNHYGCHCNVGYIGDGKDCTVDPCASSPCNHGLCVLDESHSGGFYCRCLRGTQGRFCDEGRGHCYAYGDPHYETFDGKKYDFQGDCKYVMLQPCDPTVVTPFKVIVDNEIVRRGRKGASSTAAVYVYVYDWVIGMNSKRKIMVNGSSLRLPLTLPGITIVKRGKNVVLSTDFGLEVRWNRKAGLDVSVPLLYRNNTCGLGGSWDGNSDNDFEDYESAEMFGNRWKINDEECPGEPEPPELNCSSLSLVIVRDLCQVFFLRAFERCTSLGLAQIFYDSCVYDLCVTFPETTDLCTTTALYADLCHENGFDVDLWRTRQFCPLECPEHSSYTQCASACPGTCFQPEDPACPHICVEGCECDDGFLYDGEECVRQEECGCEGPMSYLEPGETYVSLDCGQRCTCNGQNETVCEDVSCAVNAICEVQDGELGCYCNDGFYQSEEECLPDPCDSGEEHCSGNGKCVSHGDGTFHCECNQGWSGEACDDGIGVCTAYGDPHYSSFDNKKFDFQGRCRYILAESAKKSTLPGFKVIVKHFSPSFNSRVTFTDEVTVHVSGLVIELLQDKEVRVNGMVVNPPAHPAPEVSIEISGKRVIVTTNFTLVVAWDGENSVGVSISAMYFNQTQGLCGTYDGDQTTDFKTPDGEIVDGEGEFGNRWVYGECDTMEPPGGYKPCEEATEANVEMAEHLCEIISDEDGPFRDCHSVLGSETYYTNCRYDLCSTLPERGALCDDVAQYADDCRGAGVSIDPWRTEEFCPFQCPEGSSYTPCASGCPETCESFREGPQDNSSDPDICRRRCVEGCDCADGLVLGGGRCVTPEDCGCRLGGRYIERGEHFIKDGCEERCECTNDGEIECEDIECHRNAECAVSDGQLSCHCRQPLIGDGIETCDLSPCFSDPCENNGTCLELQDGEYMCQCTELFMGERCSVRRALCYVYGSLHFITFDLLVFAFQGECQYTLAKTCRDDVEPAFEVIQENVRFTEKSSVIKAIHVHIGDKVITLGRENQCYVDGEWMALPITLDGVQVRFSGFNLEVRTDFGLTVTYDGLYYAAVYVDPHFSNKLCGMCGNYDGDHSNDAMSAAEIGNSFLYGDGCALPVEPEIDRDYNPCDKLEPEMVGEAREFCNALYKGPLKPCSRILNTRFLYELCLHDACESRLNRPLMCLHPFIFVTACISLGGDAPIWRTIDYCPVDCQQGSKFNVQTSGCPQTCSEHRRGITPHCNTRRVEACECNVGHFLSGGECVPAEECGCVYEDTYYQQGHIFVKDDCTHVCECNDGRVKCTQLQCDDNAECVVADGVRACKCSDGFIGNGITCEASLCGNVTCENDGKCMLTGMDSYVCSCKQGYSGDHCELETKQCGASGDPHYQTFDSVRFDFQGECRYFFVQNCKDQDPYFDVMQQNQKDVGNQKVAFTSEIWIHFYDTEIVLYREKRTTVNGQEIMPPFSQGELFQINLRGDRVIVTTNFTLEVSWDGKASVNAQLSTQFANETCGLCGNMDASEENELASPGNDEEDPNVFGNFWVANPEECSSIEPPGENVECPDDEQEKFRSICEPLVDTRGPFRRCPDDITDSAFENCVYDGCALRPDTTTICETFADTMKRCQRIGIEIDKWRRDDFCPYQCPPQSTYKVCANVCQRRCGEAEHPDNFECPHPCEEGCECNEDHVLDSDGNCKPIEECGCFDDGFYHLSGVPYMREGCMERCTCENREINCEGVMCHHNASCALEDGDIGCHCDEGFLGNGMECMNDPCDPNPCENDGRCSPTPDMMSYMCTCIGRWAGQNCDEGVGDCTQSEQNYRTFDGKTYTFYGGCSYVLLQPCSQSDVDFRVIVEKEPDEDIPRLSNTKAVHVEIFGKAIILKQDLEVEVDGQLVNLPYASGTDFTMGQFGSIMVLTTNFGLVIVWDGKFFVDITLPLSYGGTTCGLCGNFNEDPEDDFGEHNNAYEFAEDWITNDETCDSPSEPFEPCEEKPELVAEAVEKCSIILAPNIACPSGWIAKDDNGINKCYYIKTLEDPLTFASAQLECRKLGGELLDVESEGEDSFIAKNTGVSSYWVSCNDRDEEGQWRCHKSLDDHWYLNTTENEGYWPWVEGEPNNGGSSSIDSDCIKVEPPNQWQDVSCSATVQNLICQLVRPPKFQNAFEACHEVLPPRLVFESCITSLCATLPAEEHLCRSVELYADECRLHGVDVKPWRSRDLCALECPEHSFYSQCVSLCQPTCAQPDRTCDNQCEPGCQCDAGLLHQGNDCISPDQCGCFLEDSGEFFLPGRWRITENCTQICTCTPGGEFECEDINCVDNATCVFDDVYKCECSDGFFFMDGECRPDACTDNPCEHGGQCEAINTESFKCCCPYGYTGDLCEKEDAWCKTSGAHVIRTFKTTFYSYYSDCVMTLAQHCPENDDVEPLFKIIKKNHKHDLRKEAFEVSWIRIHIHDLVIELQPGKGVTVNEIWKNLPITNYDGVQIQQSGLNVDLKFEFGLWINWNGYTDILIHVDEELKEQVCGICGRYDDYDEMHDNDFFTNNGNTSVTYAEFVNSWAEEDEECMLDSGSIVGSIVFSNSDLLASFCPDRSDSVTTSCMDEISGLSGQCDEAVEVNYHLLTCIFDKCFIGDYEGEGCRRIANTVGACRSYCGRPEPFRTPGAHCDVPCPGNSTYNFCMSPCVPTCDTTMGGPQEECTRTDCVEGCQCNEGFVLSGTKCVPREDCGCRDIEHDGAYYLNGEEFVREDCHEKCECVAGQINCEPLDCHCDATCGIVDDKYGCYCLLPYHGDGLICTVDPCNSNPCLNDGECVTLKTPELSLSETKFVCICKAPWTGIRCDISQAGCCSHGIPQHIHIFDKAIYNFFGTCWYRFVEPCHSNGNPSFRIHIRNELVPDTPGLTKLSEIRIELEGTLFINMYEGKRFTFNGAEASAPLIIPGIGILTSGSHLLLSTVLGVTIRWDGDSDLNVNVPKNNFTGPLCGLCGNVDGDPTNLLEETPDGRRVSNSVEFGNSWIVEGSECQDIGNDFQHVCNGVIERSAAELKCGMIRDESGPFADCIKHISPDGFFSDCVYDVCATNDPNTVCRHLSILEAHCLDFSFEIGFWRSPEICVPQCPPSSHFRRLTKPCPTTCLEAIAEVSIPCGYADQAGCECAPGHYRNGNECVPKHQCGCVYEETRYAQPYEEFVTSDCGMHCTCYPGNRVECEPQQCHENAFCGFYFGGFGCHCDPRYEGDGLRCVANPCARSPCMNGGECVFVDDLQHFCICPSQFFGPNCETVLQSCSVVGGVHYKTFDGLTYDYMGYCEDTLVTTCDMDDGLNVVKINQTSDGEYKSAIRVTSASLHSTTIELRQDKVIYINNVQHQPPVIGFAYKIYLSGSWLVLVLPLPDVLIRWDGVQQVEIHVSDALSSRLCGLCGTFDGNADNDFVTPAGDSAPNALDFGNSWDSCGDTVDIVNPCDTDTLKKTQADNACNIFRDSTGLLGVCFGTIPPELYYDRCEYDLCMSLPDTSDRCTHISDYAQLCIEAGVQIDPAWRDQINCHVECPSHSTYSSCIHACPPSCLSERLFLDPRQCWQYCNDGCVCDEGYVLSGYRCVPRDQCGCQQPSIDGTGWEHLPVGQSKLLQDCNMTSSCSADKELTFDNTPCSSDAQCLIVNGATQCVCNGDLVGNGHECSESPCMEETCQNGGTCKVLSPTEFDCICLRGWIGANCQDEAKQCMVHGDPHYKTFDDVFYDFMGGCAYYLVSIMELSIVQINQQFEGTDYTTMKELIVVFQNTEVRLLQNKVVMVDGETVIPPYHSEILDITLGGNYIFASLASGSIFIKWNGVDSAEITMARNPDEDSTGLCGNFNGDSADEFQNPSTNIDPVHVFGDRHKYDTGVECSLTTMELTNPCESLFDTELADRLCGLLIDNTGPFKDCTIDSDAFYTACRYDVCASSTVDTTHACGVIAAYAQACHESGFPIGAWREPNRCELTCPENAVYSQCADPCPKSCRDNTNLVNHCPLPCVEGCTCDEGFYQDDDKCVSHDNCGCFYGDNDSNYVQFNEHFYKDSCSVKCTCTEAFGEVECEPVTCHENATCQDVNQLQQCVCDEGFVGDGETCIFVECANSPCADGADCLRRENDNPTYVCQCNIDGTMGLDCDIPAVYNERSICFGAECSTGLWNSPGYPNNYPNSFKGFYVIWVPQARYINITFSESFSIEKDRDALYVGPGFQYPLSLNTGPVSSQPGVVYQLDGYSSPGPVYILGDAAWLYFFTDDTTSVNGWQAAWEAGFEFLQDTPLCWDGSETRFSGSSWEYGKCDQCICDQGTITCTLEATKPIACETNSDCHESAMCLPAADTICVVEPCEGFFCDRGTIFTDCDENPLCAEIAVSANPASMPQGTTVTELCDNLLNNLNMATEGCVTFECALSNSNGRKKRAASEDIVVDLFLEIDSSSDGATPTSAPGDLQPVDVIALSLVEELKLHISDGSLSVNITDIMYTGPKANTQAPPTTTDKSVKKEKVETVDSTMPISSIMIIAAGCSAFTIFVVIVMITTWCRFHRHRTAKKTMTFEHPSEEAHTNELFEMSPSFQQRPFARAVPLNDGTGFDGNVYGLKYDTES
ncbi:IgGFc-binding protein-like isoform X2 [Asterias rubens]|nr:IgGFc-binding protein-like isoform X2 [Asterias rubens]